MSMDPWLSQLYGTGGAAEDLEKIAQAEMAQQLAQQEGVDLSNLSEEQIAALGQEVLGGGQLQVGQQPQNQQMGQQQSAQPQEQGFDPSQLTDEVVNEAQQILQAAQQGQQVDPAVLQEAQAIMQVVEQMQAQQAGQQTPEMAKVAEAQAKFEEADFLGRVMAHSFNQESEKIAASKQAGMMGQVAHHARGAVGAADRGVQHVGKKLFGAVARSGGAEAKMHPNAARAIGAGALGAGAAGAGAVAHHMMHKEATIGAIEKAAMQQAANILQQNGIDPTTGQPIQQQQPNIAPASGVQPPSNGVGAQAALGELVEKRAHQILRGLGYNI